MRKNGYNQPQLHHQLHSRLQLQSQLPDLKPLPGYRNQDDQNSVILREITLLTTQFLDKVESIYNYHLLGSPFFKQQIQRIIIAAVGPVMLVPSRSYLYPQVGHLEEYDGWVEKLEDKRQEQRKNWLSQAIMRKQQIRRNKILRNKNKAEEQLRGNQNKNEYTLSRNNQYQEIDYFRQQQQDQDQKQLQKQEQAHLEYSCVDGQEGEKFKENKSLSVMQSNNPEDGPQKDKIIHMRKEIQNQFVDQPYSQESQNTNKNNIQQIDSEQNYDLNTNKQPIYDNQSQSKQSQSENQVKIKLYSQQESQQMANRQTPVIKYQQSTLRKSQKRNLSSGYVCPINRKLSKSRLNQPQYQVQWWPVSIFLHLPTLIQQNPLPPQEFQLSQWVSNKLRHRLQVKKSQIKALAKQISKQIYQNLRIGWVASYMIKNPSIKRVMDENQSLICAYLASMSHTKNQSQDPFLSNINRGMNIDEIGINDQRKLNSERNINTMTPYNLQQMNIIPNFVHYGRQEHTGSMMKRVQNSYGPNGPLTYTNINNGIQPNISMNWRDWDEKRQKNLSAHSELSGMNQFHRFY